MDNPVRNFSKKIAESNVYYIIALLVGIILMLIMLAFNGFDLQTLYTTDTVVTFLSISGVVMKFLSGFGIMLTYASVCTFVFLKSSDGIKGNKRRLTVLKVILIVPVFAILLYAAYTLVNALLYSQTLSFFENLTTLYGIWSLLILVYLLPIVLGKYHPEYHSGALKRFREHLGNLRYSLWKGYQSYIWKDYGRVYSAEFTRYHERMNAIRTILSAFLLWPIALVLMVIPPLGVLSIMLWFRLYSLDYKPFSELERIFLIIIVGVVLLITTYVFLVSDLSILQTYLDLSYVIGIVSSITLFGFVIWKA